MGRVHKSVVNTVCAYTQKEEKLLQEVFKSDKGCLKHKSITNIYIIKCGQKWKKKMHSERGGGRKWMK